jgi:signal recognition particle receptor subunit alpha
VQAKLVGKKLNSLYRVQTAVQQALETTLTSLLKTNVDLLRSVVTKRGDKSLFSRTPKRPYVIAVVGINGVGKSTSLAKLAYYFKENGCSPLLVAGDTFRSGAVEHLFTAVPRRAPFPRGFQRPVGRAGRRLNM